MDLGLVHSSSASDWATLTLKRLRQAGDLENGLSPGFLARNWPATKERPTKSVRDAFFASPKFPRLLSIDAVRESIQRGVMNGVLACVGRTGSGDYKPFVFNRILATTDIELSKDMCVITRETAGSYAKELEAKATKESPEKPLQTQPAQAGKAESPDTIEAHPPSETGQPVVLAGQLRFAKLEWSGEVPPQKWMNFYTKGLAKFATAEGLKRGQR